MLSFQRYQTLFLSLLYNESSWKSTANSIILWITFPTTHLRQELPARPVRPSSWTKAHDTCLLFRGVWEFDWQVNLQPGGAAAHKSRSPATQSSLGSINLAETLAFSNSLSLSCINIVISSGLVKTPGEKYLAELSRFSVEEIPGAWCVLKLDLKTAENGIFILGSLGVWRPAPGAGPGTYPQLIHRLLTLGEFGSLSLNSPLEYDLMLLWSEQVLDLLPESSLEFLGL